MEISRGLGYNGARTTKRAGTGREDTMQEMYYYDVQIGAPEMMRQAFGAYAPDEISD